MPKAKRVPFGRPLIICGVLAMIAGVVVGLEVERRIGTGLRELMATYLYSGDLRTWRLVSLSLVAGGLGLSALGAFTNRYKLAARTR